MLSSSQPICQTYPAISSSYDTTRSWKGSVIAFALILLCLTSPCRAERLLRQAMRTVPIAVDTSTQLDVVYEDGDFIAVNKPVGYHTAPIHRWQGGSMVNILLGHLQQTPNVKENITVGVPCDSAGPEQHMQQAAAVQQLKQHQPHAKPYVVHRLDYNTSGVLLFGKRREVVPGVSAQFRSGSLLLLVIDTGASGVPESLATVYSGKPSYCCAVSCMTCLGQECI